MPNTIKFKAMWLELNKKGTWDEQKNYIIAIAPMYGISISEDDWHRIFTRYDALMSGFRFSGWEIDEIQWIERQIQMYEQLNNLQS